MSATAAQFGKVALLLGGSSAEREISLRSGQAVFEALQRQGVDVHKVDPRDDGMQALYEGGFDRVFIMLHGRGGEDGTMQGALEIAGLPYTGSGVLGSALGMDKLRCKQLWSGAGLATPKWQTLASEADCVTAIERLGLPLIIKPVHEGSSIGMSKVEQAEQLVPAWQQAAQYDDVVIAEQWIAGAEYTATILGDEVLPLIRLETPNRFYDFDAKYAADTTRYHCPCGLDEDTEQEYAALALTAYRAVGASGWGRVDFMTDAQGQAWVIEVNTVPGMTDHSLVPMAAKAAGIGFDELVTRILATSMAA
ncbi:MAG: D-alanine--D-alanine ligase [Granulosicoccaceae bacterium]|jgi:D-alanine-D-alanine ligase